MPMPSIYTQFKNKWRNLYAVRQRQQYNLRRYGNIKGRHRIVQGRVKLVTRRRRGFNNVRRRYTGSRRPYSKHFEQTYNGSVAQAGEGVLQIKGIQFPTRDEPALHMQRDKDYVFLKGIQLNMQISARAGILPAFYWHVYVLQARDFYDSDVASLPTQGEVKENLFLNKYGAGDKYKDFTDQDWAFARMYDKLNRDKWNVLHKSIHRVGSRNEQTQGGREDKRAFRLSKYLKVNKRVEFAGAGSAYPTRPIVVVYWCQACLPSSAGTGYGADYWELYMHSIVSFRD